MRLEEIDAAGVLSGLPNHIHEVIDRHVKETPDRPALIEDGGALSYRELDAAVRATADALASLGLRAGSEFVSAVIIGLGIGWVLDRALHTNPAFLIVFFLIGVAAGIWNVIRLTSPKRSP